MNATGGVLPTETSRHAALATQPQYQRLSQKPMQHTTVRVDDDLHRSLSQLAEARNTSQSEVVRELLTEAVAEADDLPEPQQRLARREAAKQQHRLQQFRGGFRSRLRRQLKTRWERKWSPDEVETVKPSYHAEAEALWGGDGGDPEALQEAHEAVDRIFQQYREAWNDSAVSADENPFERYSGVQEGQQQQERQQETAEARREARRLLSQGLTPSDVRTRLVDVHGLSALAANRAVEAAQEGDR